MRQWGEKIKARIKGGEYHQIRPERKPPQPIQTLIQTQKQPDHSTTAQKHPNLVESGGEKSGEKKVRNSDENYVEKLKKQPNIHPREGEVRSGCFTDKPMIFLLYQEAYFKTNDLDHIVPSVAVSLLREFGHVFPVNTPSG